MIPRLTHVSDKNQHLSDYRNQLSSIATLWPCVQSQAAIRGSTWTLVSNYWKLASKIWTWLNILLSCYHISYYALHGSCESSYPKARGHSVFNTSRQLHKACGWSVGARVLCEQAMRPMLLRIQVSIDHLSSHALEDYTTLDRLDWKLSIRNGPAFQIHWPLTQKDAWFKAKGTKNKKTQWILISEFLSSSIVCIVPLPGCIVSRPFVCRPLASNWRRPNLVKQE